MIDDHPQPERHERTVYAAFDTVAPPTGPRTHQRPDRAGDPGPLVGVAGAGAAPGDVAGFSAVALFDNVHVLAPLPPGETRGDLVAQAADMAAADPATLDPFDLPERDRMYALAATFVANHVRRVPAGRSVRTRRRVVSEGALLVAQRAVPRLPLRRVRFTWAIDHHSVVDITGHRAFAFRLRRFEPPPRRFIWAPGKGDVYDLAYLVANVCAILGLRIPRPLAASGVVALETNQVLGSSLSDGRRRAASDDGMHSLILPFAAHLMPGNHGGVRYWPARDANEAIFSMLSAASSGVVVPDLKRRWRLKMTVSWISLVAVLLSFGVFQLAGLLVANPVLTRSTAGVAAVLLLFGAWATRTYRRLDR